MEGSFGWILSTNHGEHVAQGMGPARGLFSMIRFLIRVAEYTAAMVDPWKGRIVTDSQSVLNALAGKDITHKEHTISRQT
jgi:hypothetical protein